MFLGEALRFSAQALRANPVRLLGIRSQDANQTIRNGILHPLKKNPRPRFTPSDDNPEAPRYPQASPGVACCGPEIHLISCEGITGVRAGVGAIK